MSALDTQIAGSHYRNAATQPVEYAAMHRLDGPCLAILKYIVRHGHKPDAPGSEDIAKALHYVDLREELSGRYPPMGRRDYTTEVMTLRTSPTRTILASTNVPQSFI